MGTPILRPRARVSLVHFTILLIVMFVACETDPAGPGSTILGHLQIQPALETSVDPARLGLDAIRVTVLRESDGTRVVDTTVAYNPSEDDVFGWVLDLETPSDLMVVRAEVLSGVVPMFAAESTLVLDETAIGESEVQTVHLPYIGPGWNIASLEIDPGDSLVSHGDFAQFRVFAIDEVGEAVTDFVVVWETTDPSIATIDSDAVLQAPATGRTSVKVIATTPTGVADSANVRFLPLPDSLVSVRGDGDSVEVNADLPLQVQVLGTDGLGIEQATVTFSAPAGAGITEAVVVTGPDGFASTVGTVGTAAGVYEFQASVAGIPEATLNVVALAGPVEALQFTTVPEEVSVNVDLEPAVLVSVVDVFGNVVQAADNTVTLRLEPNALDALLIGTTTAQAVDGVARFASVRVDKRGDGFRMIAEADGLASASSDPFNVIQSVEDILLEPTTATFVAFADTLTLRAAAFDGARAPVLDARVQWTSSNEAVATVDEAGLVTAVGNGTASVTAASGDVGASAEITVAQQVTSVVISPREVVLSERNATEQLSVVVSDANDFTIEEAEVEWSSSNTGVAGVDQNGLVIANGDGIATISATSGEFSDEILAEVFVTAVETIVVSPEISYLDAFDATVSLSAEARDSDGAPIPGVVFDWSSSDESIATVDENGNVTARTNGSVAIFAAYRDQVGSALVEVSQVAATVEVTPSSVFLGAVGSTTQFEATVSDANGYLVAGAEVTWSSSNETVASVDAASGEATAVGNGTAAITATSGEVADVAQLTVSQEVVLITVVPPAAILASLNESVALTAIAWDAGGNEVVGVEFGWVSTASGVATVGATTGSVVAESNGSTNILATVGDVSGSSVVTVSQEAASIAITPQSASMVSLGESVDFSATAWDAGGSELIDAEFNWVSSADGIATIVSTGSVKAVANGTATITVMVDEVSASAEVTVAQEVASVTVTPGAATLASLGELADLVATAWDAGGSEVVGVTFDWESSVEDVATVGATGRVSAVSNGASTITATTTVGGISASAEVTVDQAIASIAITPPTANLVSLGETVDFTATAYDASGHEVADAEFNWVSSAEGVATVGLTTGSVLAVSNGAATITATVGGLSGSADVTVSQRVASVLVTPTDTSFVSLGESVQLLATALDARGEVVADAEFRWMSSAEGVATVGSTGSVLAVADGSATITATAGEVSGSAAVTVDQQVDSVAVTPSDVSLVSVGESANFTATAWDAGGNEVTDAVFSWESSAESVATVGPGGTVVAESNGSATITVTADGASASAAVTVSQQIVSVTVTPDVTDLVSIEASTTLLATAWDARGNEVAGTVFSWASSADNVATVGSTTGTVSAVSNGSVTITATTGNVTGSADVTVTQEVALITVTPESASLLSLGESVDLDATAWDAGGTEILGVAFDWASSAESVATVGAVTGTVVAESNGSATISATAAGLSGTAQVTVLQVVVSVAVIPQSASLVYLGEETELSATAWDAGGSQIEGAEFIWVSSAASVATVGASGTVSAVSNGSATITATVGAVSDSAAVVVAQEVVSVTVSPQTHTLVSLGEMVDLDALALDAGGSEVDTAFSWGSSTEGVAVVDGAGLVSAVSNGSATISASVGDISGNAAVTVAQEAASIEVAPSTMWFGALGETENLTATVRDALGSTIVGAPVRWDLNGATGVVAVDSASGVVIAVGNGETSVVAMSGEATGIASATVQQIATSVEVTPDSVGFDAIGDTANLSATVRDVLGNVIANASVTWAVNGETGVADVGAATGVVEAVGNGTVSVVATSGGVSDQAVVTVAQVAASVAVAPSTATLLEVGATQQLVATVQDANGYALVGATVTWVACPEPPAPADGPVRSTGVPGCAVEVTLDGLVTAVSAGVATVRATHGVLTGDAQVTVSLSLSSAALQSEKDEGESDEWIHQVFVGANSNSGGEANSAAL